MPGFSHAGDELVHDADASADETVLRLPAQLGDLRATAVASSLRLIRASAEATSSAADELSPARDRNFAVHEQIRSLKLVPALPKYAGNAEHVVAPCADALLRASGRDRIQNCRGILRSESTSLRSGRGGDCYIGREANGGGHDEAVVVVGVFADQVDAAGRAEDSRLIAEDVSRIAA